MSETQKDSTFGLDTNALKELDNLNLSKQEVEERCNKGETFAGICGKEIYNIKAKNLVVTNEDKTSKMTITNKNPSKPTIVRIEGPIFDYMGEQFIKNLQANRNKDLKIYISSPGGSVAAGTAMFDAMMAHEGHIETIASGHVASMGAVLFLGGDTKRITASSELMYHEVSPTEKQLEALKKLVNDANKALARIIRNRTGLSDEQVASFFAGKDVWLNADEAVEMGIADAVIDNIPDKKKVSTNKKSTDYVFGDEGLKSLLTLTNQYFPESKTKEYPVEFTTWLEGKVDNVDNLTDEQTASWKEVYDAQVENGLIEGIDPQDPNPAPTGGSGGDKPKTRAERLRREMAIEALCGKHLDIAADAMENDWSDDEIKMRIENKELKAAKDAGTPNADNSFAWFTQPGATGENLTVHVPKNRINENNINDALVAAVALQLDNVTIESLKDPYKGMSGKDLIAAKRVMNVKPMTDELIDIALNTFQGTIQEMASVCSWQAKLQQNPYAFDPYSTVENSFSTVQFPTRFKEVFERAILAGFQMMSPQWMNIAWPVTVTDFKKHHKYRMYGTGRWEKKPTCGELTHAEVLIDDAHFNQAETYGQILEICRDIVINNDIGSINQIASRFAMMGRMAPEWGVWDFVRENLIGATAFTFTYENMKRLWECFCRKGQYELNGVRKDKCDDFQIAIELQRPRLLISRCDHLKVMEILNGGAVLCGEPTSPTQECEVRTIMNALMDMFDVVDSSYMPEGFATLIPAPSSNGSVIEVAFLNGRQLPTIERVGLDNNKLGFGMRGWIDFGVNSTSNDFSCNQEDIDAFLATQVNAIQVNASIEKLASDSRKVERDGSNAPSEEG